ncbi:MAG: hypothetical protein WCP69_13075 [Bacteroidota bacterium]
MKPNEKEEKIIALLNEGKSYTFIQDKLQVSPSKISAIKRKFFIVNCENSATDSTTSSIDTSESGSSENSANMDDNFDFNPKIKKIDSNNNQKNQNFNNNKFKKPTIMENTNDPNSFSYNLELEKLRLEKNHVLELKKLELQQEELELKNGELNIKRSLMNNESKKIERQSKTLIFQFRKLMAKYQNGKWKYSQICEQSNALIALQEQIQEFCFQEDIDTDNLIVLMTLNKTIENFKEYAAEIFEIDEDDCDECDKDCEGCDNNEEEYFDDKILITIDSETQTMIDQSQTIDFDDYD